MLILRSFMRGARGARDQRIKGAAHEERSSEGSIRQGQ